jgi:quinol monooxygenase YgiN
MYGLIGNMVALPGQRDALVSILLTGIRNMPGCLSYIVAHDTKNPDSIWITEVWESEEHHKASLSLPAVKEAISLGKPLIASFGSYHTTRPVGGAGLGS